MSQPDFFVTAAAAPAAAPAAPPPAPATPVAQRDRGMRWLLVGTAVALVGAVVFGWLQWRSDSRPVVPDLSTAREFGRQAGLEMPAPVTVDECAAALTALPGIARDSGRRAAFIDSCVHAR